MLTARLVSIVRQPAPHYPKKRATRDERAFADQATRIIRAIVRSTTFLNRVQRAEYSWSFWLAPDNTLHQKTSKEVADIISGAVGAGDGARGGDVDLVITLADLSEKALAKTFPRERETQTDRDFFEQCLKDKNPGELAAVWMHEWMHTLGFVHRTDIGDQFDVPYTIERIVRALSASLSWRRTGMRRSAGSPNHRARARSARKRKPQPRTAKKLKR